MANFKKNEDGVSAVIGVILMVAITVILAAVIAAFVFQLGGNVPKNKQIGVEVKRTTTPGVVGVKTMSGSDVALLLTGTAATSTTPTYDLMVNGAKATPCAAPGAASGAVPNYDGGSVGSVCYFTGVGDNADVTVVAHFSDNTDYPAWSGTLA